MQRRARLTVLLFPLLALLALLLGASCDLGAKLPVGPLQEFHQLVEAGGASEAKVALRIGIGECEILGDGEGVMEAAALYNVAQWEPKLSITEGDGRVDVVMRQGGSRGNVASGHRNEWTIRLGKNLPIALDLDLGIGKTRAAVAGVTVRSIHAGAGVGDFLLDLDGVVGERIAVEIDAGIGKLELRLPRRSVASVKVDQGIGGVSAEGLAKSEGRYRHDGGGGPTIDVVIDAGVGEVVLAVAG